MDEAWHAMCWAIYKGVTGPERKAKYYQFKELHQAVKSKNSNENKKAKGLWTLKEARDKEIIAMTRATKRRSKPLFR